MEELEAELSSIPSYKEPENVKKEKESLKSRTDPECGYIHQVIKSPRLYSYRWISEQCKTCPDFSACATELGTVRINASAYYPSFYRYMSLIGNGIKFKAAGKNGLNNRIYEPFYGISKTCRNKHWKSEFVNRSILGYSPVSLYLLGGAIFRLWQFVFIFGMNHIVSEVIADESSCYLSPFMRYIRNAHWFVPASHLFWRRYAS